MGSDSQVIHRPQAELTKEAFGSWFYAQAWRFSNQRLVKQLGYEPEFSLAQTLKDTLQMAK
ncbi:MAG: hypothetical protein AB8B99_10340 [Phormidesmis sp.]